MFCWDGQCYEIDDRAVIYEWKIVCFDIYFENMHIYGRCSINACFSYELIRLSLFRIHN